MVQPFIEDVCRFHLKGASQGLTFLEHLLLWCRVFKESVLRVLQPMAFLIVVLYEGGLKTALNRSLIRAHLHVAIRIKNLLANVLEPSKFDF